MGRDHGWEIYINDMNVAHVPIHHLGSDLITLTQTRITFLPDVAGTTLGGWGGGGLAYTLCTLLDYCTTGKWAHLPNT